MTERGSPSARLRALVYAAVAIAGALVVLQPATAIASKRQIAIIQDGAITSSPSTELPNVRALGASTIRVFVTWYSLAPKPASKRMPRRFNGADPADYPRSHWAPYDTIVRTARQLGITVDFELTGGSPRWASGADAPRHSGYTENRSYYSWKPNPKLYGQFVHAVSERYDGRFQPRGQRSALPRVHFWSFWNEPNFGQDLGPQTTDGSIVPVAPRIYRALLNAGWRALLVTGHRHDTLLIGELAAKGYALHEPGDPGRLPGQGAQTRSLDFLRAVYCLDDNYRRLAGATAARFGCPASAAGSRRFRAVNPALFHATGFAIHAYDSREAPNTNPAEINPDYATFPVLRRVAAALDRTTRAYGSRKHYPIYNDEFGYVTSPPAKRGKGNPSPARAAVELNQAEYLSYRNPRVAAYSQYLISDPPVNPRQRTDGFSSGLYTSSGKAKPTLNAYRLPVWLPSTTVHPGARTQVWGGARPAVFLRSAARARRPIVSIQMRRRDHTRWTTISTVRASPSTGYFDVHPRLPYSGSLRLAYTYPKTEPFLPLKTAGSTIHSRVVSVTLGG